MSGTSRNGGYCTFFLDTRSLTAALTLRELAILRLVAVLRREIRVKKSSAYIVLSARLVACLQAFWGARSIRSETDTS